MMTVVISRSEAQDRGLKRYFTSKPCKRGHIAERFTTRGDCVVCAKDRGARWASENRDYCVEKSRRWNSSNRERHRAANLQWRSNNRDFQNELVRSWQKNNPDRKAFSCAKRRAQKLSATPPWADLATIEAIYAEARRLTDETGIPHEVDHIHPLQGENFCGLHVPHNLQVIPAEQNRRKSNKLPELEFDLAA